MNEQYDWAQTYSETSFWSKVRGFAKLAGYGLTEKALWLYYAAQKPEVPAKAKAVIWSALGYFILPLDAVVDALPVVGFGDDLAVLMGALVIVATYIDDEVKARANAKLRDWFGPQVLSF
jgi:uncharacterized membrane protein YkvA (DUF1232 family)